MEAPPLERKLVAILAADVASYSRMMEIDEEGTLATLSAFRLVTDRLISQHEGRICGRRLFASGRQKLGTLCRKHGRAPAEPSVAESAEAKRYHHPGRGLGNDAGGRGRRVGECRTRPTPYSAKLAGVHD